MNGVYACNACGYLTGKCGAESYECLCFLPDSAVKRRYRRFLDDLHKHRARNHYDPEDYDPLEAS
jgi:hypothetical protein